MSNLFRKFGLPSEDAPSVSDNSPANTAFDPTFLHDPAPDVFTDPGDPFPLATGGSASVSNGSSAPVASIPTLADWLTNGFWTNQGALPHHWASNTITYNLGNLTASEQTLALSALNAWHEVANVNFVLVSSGANITFNHNGTMQAATSASWDGSGHMLSATVDISSDWIATDGGAQDGKTGIDSYGYQTYIHEIGHALGLGHQGPYNGSANYSTDAIFRNDTWQYSVMSYFSEDHYSGSSYRYVITPQMADIYAVGLTYGAATTRSGDTVYGFNNTAGSIFDFTNYTQAPALTIYDSGGIDTLDCSGYSNNQTIDLHDGGFSSVGGLVNNIGIAVNSIIEKAIGGSGNDTLIANDLGCTLSGGAGIDTLIGGAAADRLIGSAGRDTMTGNGGADIFAFASGDSSAASGQHDLVTDFTSGDHIDVSAIGTFHFLGTGAFDGSTYALDYSYNSSTGTTTLFGDINGDKVADFAIDLTGNVALSAGDITGVGLNHPPTVSTPSGTSVSASAGQSIQFSTLFAGNDADGDTLTYYLYDANAAANSGHWVVNGTIVAAQTIYQVTAAQLAQTTFVAGTAGNADSIYVEAYDGKAYSGWNTSVNVSVPGTNNPPTVSTPSGTSVTATSAGQVYQFSTLFAGNDADGDPLTYYLYDANAAANSGHWVVNGTIVAAQTIYQVTAAQLAQTTYVAGAAGTADGIYVEAYDGKAYSGWNTSVTVSVPTSNSPIGDTSAQTSFLAGVAGISDHTFTRAYGEDHTGWNAHANVFSGAAVSATIGGQATPVQLAESGFNFISVWHDFTSSPWYELAATMQKILHPDSLAAGSTGLVQSTLSFAGDHAGQVPAQSAFADWFTHAGAPAPAETTSQFIPSQFADNGSRFGFTLPAAQFTAPAQSTDFSAGDHTDQAPTQPAFSYLFDDAGAPASAGITREAIPSQSADDGFKFAFTPSHELDAVMSHAPQPNSPVAGLTVPAQSIESSGGEHTGQVPVQPAFADLFGHAGAPPSAETLSTFIPSQVADNSFSFGSYHELGAGMPDILQPNSLAAELTALVQSTESFAEAHAGQVPAQGTIENLSDHADHFLIR